MSYQDDCMQTNMYHMIDDTGTLVHVHYSCTVSNYHHKNESEFYCNIVVNLCTVILLLVIFLH